MKPKMEERHRVTMPVNGVAATLTADFTRFSNGSLHMVIEAVDVNDAKTGKRLGRVAGCIGGGIEVIVGDRHWKIDVMSLWRAVEEMDRVYDANTPKPPE